MDDLISRQAALEKVRTMQTYKLFVGDDMILIDKADVQTELMMLPSVKPESQGGEWIIEKDEHGVTHGRCPKCGMVQYAGYTNFCPDCGAKLKGGAR